MDDDEAIQAHLDRQADVPAGMVRLDDGRLRPVGGSNDNASPRRGDPDYLPDPAA
jgi:hypothetical protein